MVHEPLRRTRSTLLSRPASRRAEERAPRSRFVLIASVLLVSASACLSGPTAPQETGAISLVAHLADDATFPYGGDTIHLEPGATLRFSVTHAGVPPMDVEWWSTNEAIVRIEGSGLARAVTAGTATIVARAGALQASAEIEVVAPQPPEDFAAVVGGIRPRGFAAVPYTRAVPAAGGREYFVAPAGSDSNGGWPDAPLRTIQRAAELAVAGDVVTVAPGTYDESVEVWNAGTAERPIVFQAEVRGEVVLTGRRNQFVPRGWTSGVQQSGAVHVTVRGLVFRDYGRAASATPYPERAAVGAIRGWRIEDSLFERAGYNAIEIRGDSVEVVRTTITETHTNALSAWAPRGSFLEGIRILDVILRGNHTRPDPLDAAVAEKVTKFLSTRGALIENVESFENRGSGFWFDTENVDYEVRSSYFHHNDGAGVFVEVNDPAGVLRGNVFVGNGGPAVRLANSAGVTIRDNLMLDNAQCVALINVDRGVSPDGQARYPLRSITIEENLCGDWREYSAVHALAGEFSSPAEMGIRVDGNVYDPGNLEALAWWPETGGWLSTLGQVRERLGWEGAGRVGVVAAP